MPDRAEYVVRLRDEDMVTHGPAAAPVLPAATGGSARLSFEALARLFANRRPTLIDADLTTIATRALDTTSLPDAP